MVFKIIEPGRARAGCRAARSVHGSTPNPLNWGQRLHHIPGIRGSNYFINSMCLRKTMAWLCGKRAWACMSTSLCLLTAKDSFNCNPSMRHFSVSFTSTMFDVQQQTHHTIHPTNFNSNSSKKQQITVFLHEMHHINPPILLLTKLPGK